MHKRCLRLTLNDYKSVYKALLHKKDKESMKFRRIKKLAMEFLKLLTCKNFDELNPSSIIIEVMRTKLVIFLFKCVLKN